MEFAKECAGCAPWSCCAYPQKPISELSRTPFVVRHAGSFFGVASLHQFEGKAPAKLESLEGNGVTLDQTKVFKQKDVQALPVKSPRPGIQFLPYNADFTLRDGDDLIILGPGGDVVPGMLTAKGLVNGAYRSSDGPRKLEVRASKPFLAEGGSGGPILHKQSGAVIGVLLTADDGRRARVIGFETLCLPKLK